MTSHFHLMSRLIMCSALSWLSQKSSWRAAYAERNIINFLLNGVTRRYKIFQDRLVVNQVALGQVFSEDHISTTAPYSICCNPRRAAMARTKQHTPKLRASSLSRHSFGLRVKAILCCCELTSAPEE